jgi:ABC-2 type transport system ATP-binding protein
MSAVSQEALEDRNASASAPTGPAALAVHDVSHAYGKRKALDHVSFEVRPASFTVLLGLNGAGKSTLFSLITRLYSTQTGSIKIFGHDVGRESGEALRRLGVVFQARTLDLDLSIQQNLLYHAALHGIGTAETKERSALVLQQTDMADRAKDKVRDLSGGQMRRVEIARALLHHPQMLLLDEPTVGLDIKARADILAHVRTLVETSGIGVLWTTHLIDELEPQDDVVVLHQGKILAKGKVAEVVTQTGTQDMRAAFTQLTGSGPVGKAL